MYYGKMKQFTLLILPLLLVLSFLVGKATLAQADFSADQLANAPVSYHVADTGEVGNPLAFSATSAATGSLSITGTIVSNIQATSAVVAWETDEPSNSAVRYGLTVTDLSLSVTSPLTATNHSVNLANLVAATQYFFEVESTDADGDTAVDDNGGNLYGFTTTTVVAAELKRRAFVGKVAGDPGETVVLSQQGTQEEVTIILPDDYSTKTPGGPRAGNFVDGAEVVILAELDGEDWVAVWVLVKPMRPLPPVAGVVTGAGPTSITVTDAKGVAHLLRGNGRGKDLSVGDVVTVLRGNSDQVNGLVTAEEVRDRMRRNLEDIAESEDEEEDERESKGERANALVKGLERLEARQIRVLNDALQRVSEDVKEKIREAKIRAGEKIDFVRAVTDRARGKYDEVEPPEDEEEDESDEGEDSKSEDSENQGEGNGRGNSGDDSPGNSGKSDASGDSGRGKSNGKSDGKGNPGNGSDNSDGDGDGDDDDDEAEDR